MVYDILIVGGGAAGLTAAIAAKRRNSSLEVCILERMDRVGKKLLATGNGRCNITNKELDIKHYHGNTAFAEYALNKFGLAETVEFFRSLGVLIKFEGQKAYPYSLQASSVLDALRFEAQELGCEIICGCRVTEIVKSDNKFIVESGEQYTSRCVIVATGGCSYPKLGSDGSGHRLLQKLGHTVTPLSPAIVQVKTKEGIVKSLKGIKVESRVTAKVNKEVAGTKFGEVLFTDYGLSGPPILQLSRLVSVNPAGNVEFFLDFMPDMEFSEIVDICKDRVKQHPHRQLAEFFTGMLNKRLGQVIVKSCGLALKDECLVLTDRNIKAMAGLIKAFWFTAVGTTGFANAQVTAGGVSCDEFDPKTLESKKVKGLFAAGEVLDVDGDCGGYNLQWAWSSGYLAGYSAAGKLEK